MQKYILIAVIAAALALPGYADKDWRTVARLKAGGDEKVVEVGQQISKMAVSCVDGTVTIKSIVVVADGKEFPYAVNTKLNKDETQQLGLGNGLNCSEIRVSEEGRGEYEIRVKK